MSKEGSVDRRFGRTTVLGDPRGGRYPHGHTLLVEGRDAVAIIDPSLGVRARAAGLPRPDLVLNSHCHEDHIAGNSLFGSASWHLHAADLPGIGSLDAMMEIYGYAEPFAAGLRETITLQFHYRARPDAKPFVDGDRFDLGGVSIRVIHTPGHTRGHSCLLVEPDGVLYLGDIDLSSFGPYYGDAWSDLEDFERSLARVREIDARWYATFHHVGVVEGREAFVERLDRFAAVIRRREERLLEFLREPHHLDEIVRHRFVYRPQDPVPWADPVERRSMSGHLERLLRDGTVVEASPGVFRAVRGAD